MYNLDGETLATLAVNYAKVGYTLQYEEFPTMEGLSVLLDATMEELNTIEHAEFQRAVAIMKAKQAMIVLSGGASGKMNPTVSKIILAAHGYSEKQEVHNTGGPQVVIQEITATMDPKEASRIYEEMLKLSTR